MNRRPVRRKGAILVLAALLLVMILAFTAFTVDLGYLSLSKAQMQNAADAAALAAAMELNSSNDPETIRERAREAAVEVASLNFAANQKVKLDPDADDIQFGYRSQNAKTGEYEISWDQNSKVFNVVKINVHRDQGNSIPLFFAPVIGHKQADLRASAIATYIPRDIVLVLDLSASMNDDSELSTIGKLSKMEVLENMERIWDDLGSPSYGKMTFEGTVINNGSTNKILNTLGLDKVPYPYQSNSWSSYINYVQTSSVLKATGFRNNYGYITLINYWLEQEPLYSQTPDLWKVCAEPIYSLKQSVNVFADYLIDVKAEDRVGVAVYTHPQGGGGHLELSMTYDLSAVKSQVQSYQAGHFDHYTNIGAGMKEGRLELENHSRPTATKIMVLMTDGIANRPNGQAKQYALQQAHLAKQAGIQITTISLGLGADKELMQQIADITGGKHFNIPGGGSVAEYTAQLKEAFREIAADRPVKLVE